MDQLGKFQLKTIYPFPVSESGSKVLSAQGVALLRRWMHKQGFGVSTTAIQEGIGTEQVLESRYSLVVQKEFGSFKNSGTLPKRVSKWAYEMHGQKLDPEALSLIGTQLEPFYVGGTQIYFDLYPTIDWVSGTFGEKADEGGSCWWTQNWVNRVRPNMPHEMLALRLFQKVDDKAKFYGDPILFYDEYVPIGRCWVFTGQAVGRPDCCVLFNAYGPNLLQIATMFSIVLMGQDAENLHKPVQLASYPLPINNNMGILIGSPEALEAVNVVDLPHWIDPRCEICAQNNVRRQGTYRAELYDADEDDDRTHYFCNQHFAEFVVDTFDGTYAWKTEASEELVFTSEFSQRRNRVWLTERQRSRFTTCEDCGSLWSTDHMRRCACKAKKEMEAAAKSDKKKSKGLFGTDYTASSSSANFISPTVRTGYDGRMYYQADPIDPLGIDNSYREPRRTEWRLDWDTPNPPNPVAEHPEVIELTGEENEDENEGSPPSRSVDWTALQSMNFIEADQWLHNLLRERYRRMTEGR